MPDAIAKCNYSHEAMADLILGNPGIKQKEIARHFGRTQAWISRIMTSNAFKGMLAARREKLSDPLVRARIKENFDKLVHRSQEVLLEKLSGAPAGISGDFALEALKVSSRAIGYGASEAAPVPVQVNLQVLAGQMTEMLKDARQGALEHDDGVHEGSGEEGGQ